MTRAPKPPLYSLESLRHYLRRAVQEKEPNYVGESAAEMLAGWRARRHERAALLDSLSEPAPEYGQPGYDYKLYSATLDYFATGEGRSLMLYVAGAGSPRSFWEKLAEKWGGYYCLGAEVREGLPPEGADPACDNLLPAWTREMLSAEPDERPHVEIDLSVYFNYS